MNSIAAADALATAHREREYLLSLPASQRLAALVDFLATKHSRRNAVAVYVLANLGPTVVPELIREAVVPGKRPDHRVRILDVVDRIGAPLDVSDWFSLAWAAGRQRQPGCGRNACN